MNMLYNDETTMANTKDLIKSAESLIINQKESLIEDLKILRKLMVHKANKEILKSENTEIIWKSLVVFYNVLPYACLSDNGDVKKIILSNQVLNNLPHRPPLDSFFTPLDHLVNEVAILSNMGFEFDHKLMLTRSIETLRGNFIKQFQWNYNMTTKRGKTRMTYLQYLGYTEISMPTIDCNGLLSNDSMKSMDSYINIVKNTNTYERKRNFKDVVLELHYQLFPDDTDKNYLFDFIFNSKLGFIKQEPIICKHRGADIGKFLSAHEKLIDIIHPNFYQNEIKGLKNRDARNKIKRNFNYKFDKV